MAKKPNAPKKPKTEEKEKPLKLNMSFDEAAKLLGTPRPKKKAN